MRVIVDDIRAAREEGLLVARIRAVAREQIRGMPGALIRMRIRLEEPGLVLTSRSSSASRAMKRFDFSTSRSLKVLGCAIPARGAPYHQSECRRTPGAQCAMALKKIVSGGQTGVDRDALEAALPSGFPCDSSRSLDSLARGSTCLGNEDRRWQARTPNGANPLVVRIRRLLRANSANARRDRINSSAIPPSRSWRDYAAGRRPCP
jgi:hypothetical protein